MILVDDHYKGIENITEGASARYFWKFDVAEEDFFLTTVKTWDTVTGDAYRLQIGEGSIWLPYNYYILIADYDSGLDCISPDEIVGREFQALTMSNELEESTSSIETMKITGYKKDMTFALPCIKTVYPILTSKDKVVLVSPKDFYNKIKNMSMGSLL